MSYFLRREDIEPFVSLERLDGHTGADDRLWQEASDAAIGLASSYLSHRYDVERIFKPIAVYDNSLAWPIYSRVDDGGTLYHSIQEVPALTPIGDTDYWVAGDSRSKIIMKCIIDLMVHNVCMRVDAVDVADQVIRGYELSIAWLKQIGPEGSLSAMLPLIEAVADGTDASGNNISLVDMEEARYKHISP